MAVAAILYLRFFRLPFVPIDPAAGDQAMFLWGATKILGGQIIYRDFFQFTTPGTEFFYALLIKLFGVTAAMPKLVALAVGVAFTAVGLAISKHLLAGWCIYAPALLFLTAGFLPWSDATHHVFSTLAVLLAFLFMLPGARADSAPYWRLITAGVFCGLAFCFTPARGIFAAIALLAFLIIFAKENKASAASALVGSFFLTALALFGPIVWRAGLHNVISCLVDYPIHHYGASPWNNLGAYGTDLPVAGFAIAGKPPLMSTAGILALVRWLLIYLPCPWVFVFAVMRVRKLSGFDEAQYRQVALVTLLGLALFASIAYAPTAYRIGITSLPAFVLLIWLLETEHHQAWRCLLVAIALFAAISLSAGIVHSQGKGFAIFDTPSGKVALSPAVAFSSADKYRWLAEHTRPGDFLFSPDYLDYDYLFQLQHPGPTATLWVTDYSTREQVEQTVDAINRERVRYVIWPEDFQDASTLGDRLSPIRALLHDKYTLDHTFSDSDEVWKRRD